jgi:hypothetical protein
MTQHLKTQKRRSQAEPSSQHEKFIEAARELSCEVDEEKFNAALGKVARHKPKACPECQHVFQGSGWDGIDAHWKSKHESIMPYAEAWPLIKSGAYAPRDK